MTNVVRYFGEDNRGPSPIIFGDLLQPQHDQLVGNAIVIYDDFERAQKHASAGASGGYYTYQDTGVLIQGDDGPPDLGDELGVMTFSTLDTAADEGHLQMCYGGPMRIDNGSGNTGAVMFETRLKVSDITNNALYVFAGLGTGPVAADYLVDDTGALKSDKGFIGFLLKADDGDQMDTVFQAANQTMNTVEANAVKLVANTYVKLGLKYDPNEVASKKIKFYVDGVEQNTKVSTTDIDAATFPEGEALTPMILCKSGAAGLADTLKVDWVAAVQYGDSSIDN